MKRPQSAKPGYRGPAAHDTSQNLRDQELPQYKHHGSRKPVKLIKPDLTTNEFARIMPKKIFQDKQRLYSQGLQLKQKLNQIEQQNIRLKTRISILEKQKDKLTKAIDVVADPSNKSQSRFKMLQGPNRSSDAENNRVRNLTKIIRQSKQQNEYLKQENAKIKKAVKFTKINEVQIQCKILREEYQTLQQLLIQMNEKLVDQEEKLEDQEEKDKKISQLKNYLEQQVDQIKQLTEENQKCVEYIQQLEQKLKKQVNKFKQKQTKLQRQIALGKKKLNQQIRIADDLRKQLRILKQNSQNVQAKKRPIVAKNVVRPMSSIPSTKPENKFILANDEQTKFQEIKKKNQTLQNQLKQLKLKLQTSEKQNHNRDLEKEKNQQAKAQKNDTKHSIQPKHQNIKENVNKEIKKDPHALRLQSQPQQNYEDQDFDAEFVLNQTKQQKNNKDQKKNNAFILSEQKKNAVPDNQYFDEFEQGSQESPKKSNPKHAVDNHIQKYNKQLQDDGEQQQLYKKDIEKKQKSKKKNKNQDQKLDQKKQKKETKSHSKENYQPDKKMLGDIKQLLTYRMKAQRYPYQDLKGDILASNQSKFNFSDLQAMMKSQPFYLTPSYTKSFLEYVFEKKQKINAQEFVSTQLLLNKLRKVIKNFELIDQKQQEQRLMSIAEMTTQYPNQLQSAFEKIKNGADTVAKKDLIQMFKKLELADHFIEIIIAELSLCSQDLNHLSIRGYFQRFYIDQIQGSNAIDEQQIQSSGQQKGNSKTNLNKGNKINKIDEQQQYEDDKTNFILEQKSSGSKNKQKQIDYNDDMVSDDGHI